MTTASLKLKNPPIREIVFTISFNENVPLEKLELFTGNKDIKSFFPTINRGMSTSITARLSHQQTTTTTTATENFILRSEPEQSKVLQAKIGSFAFHKTNGYESFDTLLRELNQYWSLFIDVAGKLTINNISLRYVNFIERDENEDINDLFEVKNQHPFGKLDSYLSHYKFLYNKETSANVAIAVANQRNQNGVVFDIMLNKKLSLTTQSLDAFIDMRDAKNDIFFRCITERTRQKYDR